MKAKQKPWLDKDGKPKSNEELKRISPSWSEATWESYWKSIESKQKEEAPFFWSTGTWEDYLSDLSKEREEYFFENPKDWENFSNEAYVQLLMSMDGTEKGLDRLRVLAKTCLNQLSQRESEVLKKIFFEKKSEKQIAEDLGVSRGSIKTFKSRGLNKIKRLMTSGDFHRKVLFYKRILMTDFP